MVRCLAVMALAAYLSVSENNRTLGVEKVQINQYFVWLGVVSRRNFIAISP